MSPNAQTNAGRLVYSVTQITREIKVVLEDAFPQVWVEGEVSNFKLHSSGHMYFALKDPESVLNCAFFRGSNQGIKFQIKDGLKILCFGRVGFYNKSGQTQLYVERVEPKGVGELQLAFEQLKERLQKEGLFDEAHKRPVPMLPSKIGIVTSPTGAAIRDILHILKRRFNDIEVLIYPVKVQGEGAAEDISGAIKEMNRIKDIDVLILARGGGSLEDLWAFNEEAVARAIYNSGIPVISAVGHEIDYTIADFVADLRAPTPSAAAELVIANKEDLSGKLDSLIRILRKYPIEAIERYGQEIDDLCRRMDSHAAHAIEMGAEKVNSLIGMLDALSPLAILKRGYSITLMMPEGGVPPQRGRLLRSVKGVKAGDIIETRLAVGRMTSEVKEISKEETR
ncbi:MAG: exodeoxyribonuclease VII large subunit [Candidatus Omnitrophica bacterium]|nr:exodeoxyribonuclease VII large subunit [Candidatus Omnitrophota bacterium]MDD5546286.1 exodeoxyribonuclease VII large subunit [Candidatus Omnitrophota bacterium]